VHLGFLWSLFFGLFSRVFCRFKARILFMSCDVLGLVSFDAFS